MKIICISDIHGNLINIEESFDLMLICGDICPTISHNVGFQESWLNQEFIPWINTLPFNNEESKVVMVAGNHDFWFERNGKKDLKINELIRGSDGRLIYLHNTAYMFKCGTEKLDIFGTPYCKIFGGWAFMRPDDVLVDKYNEIPEDIDILISHDAPDLNKMGLINSGFSSGKNAGNLWLADAIIEKKPKHFFCGHIHSGNHILTKVKENGISVGCNVSICTEDYEPIIKPFAFEIL